MDIDTMVDVDIMDIMERGRLLLSLDTIIMDILMDMAMATMDIMAREKLKQLLNPDIIIMDMDIMDIMERERQLLSQDIIITDVLMDMAMDTMDTMERGRLKLLLNPDIIIMDMDIMVDMDIMDIM